MQNEEFIKQMAKYSKGAILETILKNCFIDTERIIDDIKFTDLNIKFDKLMAQSEIIRKEQKLLNGARDIKSLTRYMKLMDEDNRVQKRLNIVIKEMDKHVGIR